MFRNYLPLPSAMLRRGTGYAQPSQAVPDRVALDDAAVNVVTDLPA